MKIKEGAVLTLREWAADFWDLEKSEYLKGRMRLRPITAGYVKSGKNCANNRIFPFLGDLRLDAITEAEIDRWLIGLVDRGISNAAANYAFSILSVMLGYACKQEVIKANPCLLTKKLRHERREVMILTFEEAQKLFSARWSDVWDNYTCYVANKLAACTGMRFGEVLGLRSECVQEGYLDVGMQYSKTAGYSEVKTHRPRKVPIHEVIETDVRRLIEANGEGFVFVNKPQDGKPMGRTRVVNSFYKALETIGIDEGERKRRNLTFHSWRYFFCDLLLTVGVADTKVMTIVGHATEIMKGPRARFDIANFLDVTDAQKNLMKGVDKENETNIGH
jgi:integrase